MSVTVEPVHAHKSIVSQIISTDTTNCTSVLRKSTDTCKGIVWQIISVSTLNSTVMFQHRALDNGTVYMYSWGVAKYFNQHIDEYRHCAKGYKRFRLKITGRSTKNLFGSHIYST